MKIGRSTALATLAAMVVIAPAWAQESQQAPPPAGPPATSSPDAGTGSGPSGPPPNARGRFRTMGPRRGMDFRGGFGGPRVGPAEACRMIVRRRGGRDVMVYRERGEFRGPMRGLGTRLARMVNNPDFRQRLGITDAQAAKVRQQTSDFQVSQIRSRADVQVNELQLRNLLSAQNPDRATIDQKLNQVSAAELALRKQQVDYMLAMRAILTPEQRQKLRQMRQAPMHRSRQGLAAPRPPAGR